MKPEQNVSTVPPRPSAAKIIPELAFESPMQTWLKSVGLHYNPFEHHDSGSDPNIPFYLVYHPIGNLTVEEHPDFVFAPPGGGKTAFRAWLTFECRTSRKPNRIFPIVFEMPAPTKIQQQVHIGEPPAHLLRSAARELFLYFLYHVEDFEAISLDLRRQILDFWNHWDPIGLRTALNRISNRAGVESLDAMAVSLPNPPGDQSIHRFKELIPSQAKTTTAINRTSAQNSWDWLKNVLFKDLGFSKIFIIIDNVDGYFETGGNPIKGIELLSWFLNSFDALAQEHIHVKFFLPEEMEQMLKAYYPDLLTDRLNFVNITWDVDSLVQIIRQRLQQASWNTYDSLRAISNRDLWGQPASPEERIAQCVIDQKRYNPRDVIRIVHWLFQQHITRPEAGERITPQDLADALDWYRRERATPT